MARLETYYQRFCPMGEGGKNMKYKNTMFSNVKYIVDESDRLVGVCYNPGNPSFERVYFKGDRVRITGDCHGFICCGIKKPGLGWILDIREDSTDHFFHVVTDNGESGFCKEARLSVC